MDESLQGNSSIVSIETESSLVFPEFNDDVTMSDQLKIEIDLGLALPVLSRKPKKEDLAKEYKTSVMSADDDGNILSIEISTQSETGPLGPADKDFINIVTTLLSEQMQSNDYGARESFTTYYTDTEICRRLGLSKNSRNKIVKSLKRVASQKFNVKKFYYNAEQKKVLKVESCGHIFPEIGKITMGKSEDIQQLKYVKFNEFFGKNIKVNKLITTDLKDYLLLRSGPERRIYEFILSKEEAVGTDEECRVSFLLIELIQVLGLEGNKRAREYITDYFKRIKKKIQGFDFLIKKDSKRRDAVIVSTQNKMLALELNLDDFFRKINTYYGRESIKELKLREIDILNMRKEYSSKHKKIFRTEQYDYHGSKVNFGEFIIDATLFQVLKTNYSLTHTFKALANSVVNSFLKGDFQLADGFGETLDVRIQEKKKEEMAQVLELESQRRFESERKVKENKKKAFISLYSELIKTNKDFRDDLRRKALDKISDLSESTPLYKDILESEITLVAKEWFEDGRILNYIGSES